LAVRSLRAQGRVRSYSLFRNSPWLANVHRNAAEGRLSIRWRLTDAQCQRIKPLNSSQDPTQDRQHRGGCRDERSSVRRGGGAVGPHRETPGTTGQKKLRALEQRVRRDAVCPDRRANLQRSGVSTSQALLSPHISQNISAITSHENGKGIRPSALAAVIRVWGVDGRNQLAQHGALGAPAAENEVSG
jgi:hypothetical protein